jgi:hypothetical protein
MKAIIMSAWSYLKTIANLLRIFTVWVLPFLVYIIIAYYVVRRIYGFDLSTFTDILKITVWPVTVLISLFFFRKVVTYMFFSMNEYNFFGAKGELTNVHKFLEEEVEARLKSAKLKEQREGEFQALTKLIESRDTAYEQKAGEAKENMSLATKILRMYTDFKKDAENKILELEQEVNRLRQGAMQGGMEASIGTQQTQGVASDLGTTAGEAGPISNNT